MFGARAFSVPSESDKCPSVLFQRIFLSEKSPTFREYALVEKSGARRRPVNGARRRTADPNDIAGKDGLAPGGAIWLWRNAPSNSRDCGPSRFFRSGGHERAISAGQTYEELFPAFNRIRLYLAIIQDRLTQRVPRAFPARLDAFCSPLKRLSSSAGVLQGRTLRAGGFAPWRRRGARPCRRHGLHPAPGHDTKSPRQNASTHAGNALASDAVLHDRPKRDDQKERSHD